MFLVEYLMVLLSFKRTTENTDIPLEFNLITDLDIHNVTAVFFGDEHRPCSLVKKYMNVSVDKTSKEEYQLFDGFPKDCLTPPIALNISCLMNENLERLDFKDQTGKVIFHAEVTDRNNLNYSFILKNGSVGDADTEGDMVTSLYKSNDSTLSYSIASVNIQKRIILDKSIDACVAFKFIEELHFPLDDLFEAYSSVYNSLDKFKDDSDKIDDLKKILQKSFKDQFLSFQLFSMNIKASYETKQYEEEILYEGDKEWNFTNKMIRHINNWVEHINGEIRHQIIPLYKEICQRVGDDDGLKTIDSMKECLDNITKKANKVVGNFLSNKPLTDAFNKLFRSAAYKPTELTQVQLMDLKKLSSSLIRYNTLRLENLQHKMSNNSSVFELSAHESAESRKTTSFISEIKKELSEDLEKCEIYLRLSKTLEIFNCNPCHRTASYLTADKTFNELNFNDMEKDLEDEREILSKKFEIIKKRYEMLSEKLKANDSSLLVLYKFERLHSNSKNTLISNLISIISKKKESEFLDQKDYPIEVSTAELNSE